MLKALLNIGFSLILLDKKKGRDRYSLALKKRAKIGVSSSKDDLLNITPYYPSLCLSRISFGFCGEDYVKKSRRENLCLGTSIANIGANDLGISKVDKNGRVNNLGLGIGIGIVDRDNKAVDSGPSIGIVDNKVDNPGQSLGKADIGANNLRTSIVDIDRGEDDYSLGISTANRDREVNDLNSGIGTIDKNGKSDYQMATSNKTRTFLFILCKILFF